MSVIYTIGFTKRKIKDFRNELKNNNIDYIIDIRENTNSTLFWFAKKDILKYIANLHNIWYLHWPFLAPSKKLRRTYWKQLCRLYDKKTKQEEAKYVFWLYKKQYIQETNFNLIDVDFLKKNKCVLLCSEHMPTFCHRKIVSDYLEKNYWFKTMHLFITK